jgi:hypothetical protein
LIEVKWEREGDMTAETGYMDMSSFTK